MYSESSEIVVLRPTQVFLAFLASQLPEINVPCLKILQTDCTAYVIKKHSTNDATLDEIEKNFSAMFHHEIGRWLGKEAHNEIETNFMNFLCCFKFELHTHIILMEPSVRAGNQLIILKPRASLLQWMKATVEDDEELNNVMEQVNLSHLSENATVIVKNFSRLQDIKSFLKQYYKPIFETAMSRMSNQSKKWPEVNTFQSFGKYFAIEIHTQLIHLNY